MISVLYVDDEPNLLDVGKIYLEQTGNFSVDTITSAPLALQSLKSQSYDALISDYQMPEMNGIEFLKALRKNHQKLPFIIFTGKGREDVAIEAFASGADFYVQKGGAIKPQFAELAHKIHTAVERRKFEKAYEETHQTLISIIDFLPDATFAIDAKGEVIAWNKAMEVMTGIKKSEVIGRGDYCYAIPFHGKAQPILIDLILHYDQQVADTYDSLQKTGDKLHSDFYIPQFYSGKDAYLWFVASPLYDKKGAIVGAIESVRDISDLKKAELALKESAQQYKNVVEDQTEFICRFLPDGTHVFVNDAYCRYFQINRDAIIGHRFKPRLHPDDEVQVRKLFASLSEENPVVIIDQRVCFPDGSVRWQRWVDRAIYDNNGVLLEYQSVGRDITDVKQAEQESRQSESIYKAVVEYTGTATVIIEEDMTFSLVNKNFETLTGFSREEILGGMRWTDYVLFEDQKKMLAYHLARRNGTPGVPTSYVFRFKTRSGAIQPVYMIVGSIPGTTKTVASLIDITGIPVAQQQIPPIVAHQYRHLADQIPGAIWITDHDLRFTGAYGAAWKETSLVADRLIGTPIDECLQGFFAPDVAVTAHRQALQGGKTNYETRFDDRSYSVHVEPIRDKSGTIIGTTGVAHEITVQKQVQQILRQVNSRLSLLHSVSQHDARNQITALVGYLYLLKAKTQDPAFIAGLEKIDDIASNLSRQIEFVEEYHTLGSGEPLWYSVSGIINRFRTGTVRITLDLRDVFLLFDPLLEKIFLNLYDNSIRHGDHVTDIHVTARQAENDLILVWEDNGIGIPAELKEKIFDRGFGKNTGLGLYLVRECLALTGITIRETGEPGTGARFEIVVPKELYRFGEDGK